MRVKLFWKNDPLKQFLWAKEKGWFFRESPQALEEEINVWLAENPRIKVIEIEQSASGGSFASSLWLISVWYEEAVG
jgi:hypothetical protein